MSSPFPGMDPYLEDSEHWHSFHHLLADEIMAQLNGLLGEKYYADVEVSTVLEEVGIGATYPAYPDSGVVEVKPWGMAPTASIIAPVAPIQRVAMPAAQVKQRTVYIYLTATKRLVTAIEILSPANKVGAGLEEYRRKRSRILRSDVHLVEIDLLRAGQRPGWEVSEPLIDSDYILLVNRAWGQGDRISEIWSVAINEPLPLLPIPLLFPDPDVLLELKQALELVYTRGAYARRVAYERPLPPPKPRAVIAAWLAAR